MNYSLQEIADGLLGGDKWYRSTLTYSFRDSLKGYENVDEVAGFALLPDSAREAVYSIMEYLERLIDVDFVYSGTTTGDIVIGATQMDETTLGYAYMPGGVIKDNSGDIYLNSSFSDADYSVGGMGYSTIIHELGHSMGLEHPFGDGYAEGVDINQSVMSYYSYNGYDAFNHQYFDVISYSSYSEADIMALQNIYGLREEENDDMYVLEELLFGERIVSPYIGTLDENLYTLYDNGGVDTISLDGVGSDAQYIDISGLRQSVITYNDVTHYVNITDESIIENMIGSGGNDYIVLNETHNVVDGKEGHDRVYVNSSNPSVRVDTLGDKVVLSSLSSGVDALENVEKIYINDMFLESALYDRELREVSSAYSYEIARLYLSVFDRLADEDGFEYWVDEYERGMGITDIAGCFVASVEFESTYGEALGNEAFIELLYENVLYRNSDEGGMIYWLHEMDRGFSRGDVLVGFSNSNEFIEISGVYFEGGVWVA